MAALPYMQFFVADYLADTGHLTTEEHGAYLLLIFNYWQTGKPLRKDRLATVARMSNDRWIQVERVLNEFFHDNGETWTHFRIEADLASVQESVEKASKAGKASAMARQRKKELKDNARSTTVETDVHTTVPTQSQPSDKIRSDKIKADKQSRAAPDDIAPSVITYLNNKTGRKFGCVEANLKLIRARITEGATWESLTGVIDLKCSEWLNDQKMHEYLRPATLFNAEKFNQYVGLIGAPRPKTKDELLDEAFGITSDPVGEGDIFDTAWEEVMGDRD